MEQVAPQVAFTLWGVPVRDTVVSTWIMMALVLTVAAILGRRRPSSLEMLVEFLSSMVSDIMGRPAAPYLPVLGALAIFVAVANVLGLIPGLQAPTRDINVTLALSLVVFFSVHFFGMREKGVGGYLRALASPAFLLPLEIVSQLSRTLSLSLRLFGNIVSAELIVAIIGSLIPLIVPLPLIGLGLLTGVLQAYIFTALATVYISGAVQTNPAMRENQEEE
jgi:F-type H+-transporting ATPase subunit a